MSGRYELREQINHGDMMFPLHVYYNDIGFGNHVMECHWHEEVEIIYMKTGKGIFQIDTANVELHSGESLFINSGSLHGGYSFEDASCEYYAIVFNLNMLMSSTLGSSQTRFINPLLSRQLGLPLLVTAEKEWGAEVLKQVWEIAAAFNEKQPGFELGIKGSLYRIFFILASNNLLCQSIQDNDTEILIKIDRIKSVLNYIYTNFQKRLSLPELASQLNMSTYHFCRFFKGMTGRTPVEYINYYRINKASQLLLETKRTVIDIALEVGFDNVSYFIKAFKRFKGCTPMVYRKGLYSDSQNQHGTIKPAP